MTNAFRTFIFILFLDNQMKVRAVLLFVAYRAEKKKNLLPICLTKTVLLIAQGCTSLFTSQNPLLQMAILRCWHNPLLWLGQCSQGFFK